MAFFKGQSRTLARAAGAVALLTAAVPAALAAPRAKGPVKTIGSTDAPGAGRAVDVVGWPLPSLDQAAPEMTLGDDPVSGRQLCPALTRLNLGAGRSEELLLRRVAEEFRDESRGSLWRLELRSGIFWWSGAPVTSDDVAAFLRRTLPDIVARRGAGLWTLPPHDVKTDGSGYVVVRWQKLAPFGPFVLNDAPFFRPTSGGAPLKYECAGLYRPFAEGFGVTLKPAPGYKMAKALPEVRLHKAGAPLPAARDRVLEWRYAGTGAAAHAGCQDTVEMPTATMVLWNTEHGPTARREFRQLMTQLVPRGALATAGAGNLAQVVAAPVPRSHPGFNARVKARPFDMRAVSDGLSRLGYKRKTAASPRLDATGRPVVLTLGTQPGSAGLVEKVIADAYAAVGIRVDFVARSGAAPAASDGILATFALDWPRVSFLGNFHGRVADTAPFWSPKDAELDRLLEEYALTLTKPTPDFGLLARIQVRLAELEPTTVVLQHRACIVVGARLGLAKGVRPVDPDWFRHLLL